MLLHDIGFTGAGMWEKVAAPLKEAGYDVICMDLAAHGSQMNRDFKFAVARHDLRAKARRIRVEHKYKASGPSNVVLVGIGLGAQVALDFTSDNPQKMAGVILSGATLHPPDDKAAWEFDTSSSAIKEYIAKAGNAKLEVLQQHSQDFKLVFPDAKRQTKFPPMLVMRGEHDSTMAKRDFGELSEMARQLNTKGDSMVLEGVGHNHAHEDPENLATIVDQWIQTLNSGRP